MSRRFSYQDFGIGLLTGIALGAVAGILLAPQAGETTRERIAAGAGSLRLSAHELAENARKSLEMAMGKMEGVFGAHEGQLRKRISDLKAELEKYNLGSA